MDRFVIAPEVAKLLPNMQVIVVAAYNLNNTSPNAMITKFAVVPSPSPQPRT